MLLIMATNTKINTVGEKPLENQDLNTVCTNLEFSDDKRLHPPRKRCLSTSIIISPSPKKKKKDSQNIIPPKKFLLGGSISDPLNLNSLQNEDINKAMNMTPKSSPLHSNTINIKKDQVNVIIPKNVCDPLELSTCNEANKICSDLDILKQKTINTFKLRKVFSTSLSSLSLSEPDLLIENTSENNYLQERNNFNNINSSPPNKKSKIESFETNKNNIPYVVVEVIEQIMQTIENEISVQSISEACVIPILEIPIETVIDKVIIPCKMVSSSKKIIKDLKETESSGNINPTKDLQSSISEKLCKSQLVIDESSSKPKTSFKLKQKVYKNEPKFKEKNAMFKYGNYNRYYGYRNPDDEDIRLKVLADRVDLFYGKDVLDIGCNIGHVTFSVARDFGAKSIVGMDIDRKLINIARKNVQYYINDTIHSSYPCQSTNYQLNDYASNRSHNLNSDLFPISLPMLYGPINLPGLTISGRFPYNVSFVHGNYVLESDSMLLMETCKFDVILCLSITKWLHLNWGDDGLKRAFKRMYAQLRPGGVLVVEPQPWKSYGRRKTLTETIWRNYKNIQFKPTMFTEYLINEVGFINCETLPMPNHPSKGFQRPLKLYRKPNNLVTRNVPNCTILKPKETQKL
ncbi:Bin3-type S-adenosyl-L-methionine binding domain,RNA methyltransferase bin3, C-terminal,S-adenosyl-L- [Cinara cedri]|uniref:RNA methyltransferase n=1 Tax=Cinara cedri TaxID=506608 RepID=A0A5E4NIE5_9HEMI|nr:Bin3-type S-adenosyl-L-methionine binding domain,RNA methyltransferase bin3, C-terminal,S-adenosyl-L- [Cinara cedri]